MILIANDHVVTFNYTLTNAEGTVLQETNGEPLAYLHGKGEIIPGLEKEFTGKATGAAFKVSIVAEEAYGHYNDALVQEVPKEMFQGVDEIAVGMEFQAQTEAGINIVKVKAVNAETIVIDANHPLAGQDLTFDVEVASVREATEEELRHGHAHGVGGYQH